MNEPIMAFNSLLKLYSKKGEDMKKLLTSLLIAGLLITNGPLNAEVSKIRAVKCSIPALHKKFNCTAEEKKVGKKWLIGASVAAAVTALTAIVVGGVKYKQVQQAKKQAELEARQEAAAEKTTRANQQSSPTPAQTPSIPAQPKEIPTTIPFAELAKSITIDGIEAVSGAFGNLFDRVIPMRTAGQNMFQKSLEIVKTKLDEKTRAAQQALQAVGEQKNQLLAKAESAYRQALEQANNLTAQVRSSGEAFMKQTLKELFDINYDAVKQSIARFNTSMSRISPKLTTLSNVPTWDNLQTVMGYWFSVQGKGYDLWENLSEFLIQLAERKLANAPTVDQLDTVSKPKRAELLKLFWLTYKFDHLYKIYPKFLKSVATTNVAVAGQAAEQVLSQTGQTFQDLADIYSQSGVWGRLLLTNEMIDPLISIGGYMKTVGKNLQEFTASQPLQQLTKQLPQELNATSVGSWFKAVAWHPKATVSGVTEIVSKLTPQMLSAQAQLFDSLTKATDLSNTFIQHSNNMPAFIKQTIVTELSQKPFQNYLNVAKQAVAKEAKISKELFNDVILHTAGVINYFEKLLTPLIETIEHLNTMLSKELVTESNLSKLKQSAAQLKAMTSEIARLRNAAKASLSI